MPCRNPRRVIGRFDDRNCTITFYSDGSTERYYYAVEDAEFQRRMQEIIDGGDIHELVSWIPSHGLPALMAPPEGPQIRPLEKEELADLRKQHRKEIPPRHCWPP